MEIRLATPARIEKRFFRADHVGSLLRPAELLAARDRFAHGEMSREALRAVEDAAIRDVVAEEQNVGLQVVTDGEFRRDNWWIDFIGRLQGVRIEDGHTHAFAHDPDKAVEYVPKDVVTREKLGWPGPVLRDDFAFLASVARVTPKITLPSPSRIHFHGGRRVVSTEAYPEIEEFFADVAVAYRREIAALEDAGCRYLQIDDPLFSYFIDDTMRAEIVADGDDPDARLARYVRLLNDCIAETRPETMVAVHVCRGNARSAWMASGGYERIAEAVFGGLDVDQFLLEFDDARSGGFEPLRFIPEGKRVVLGLVTTKRGALEDPDVLCRRVDEATKYVPLDHLAISPQCGFASTHEGNIISSGEQWAKLRLVVATARRIWGEG
jgi:5-methyltetrahydropteroyltriglutamate--homocysteine methyltransferase